MSAESRAVLALVVVLTLACGEEERLSPCGLPCGTLREELAGVGQCVQGTYSCDALSEATCVGEVLPSVELCDNVDNDCDGDVDDWATGGPPLSSCRERVGICYESPACVEGEWQCVRTIFPEPETCNGVDDDCDGETDEIEVSVCASLPLETYAFGRCKPGIELCLGGQLACIGEVLPEVEVCDSEDNDCDGLIDENADAVPAIVVVYLDVSTSFDNFRAMADEALMRFAALESTRRVDTRFVLVRVDGVREPFWSYSPLCGILGCSADDFVVALADPYRGFGFENTLDAIANSVREIEWPMGFKRVGIGLIDEAPQGSSLQLPEVVAPIIASAFDEFSVWTVPLERGWFRATPNVESLYRLGSLPAWLESARTRCQ